MKNTILIATAARPMTQEKCNNFNEIIRHAAKESGMTVLRGIWWAKGPYCANLAFDIEGKEEKDHETFANAVCMQLNGKWEFTSDKTPMEDQWDFEE